MATKGYEFNQETDREVAGLLAGLPRVDAPGDFNARVRARIADGRPLAATGYMPFLRIAVPACLLLVLGGYFAYSSLYSRPTPQAVATSTEHATPEPAAAAPQIEQPSQDQLASNPPTRSEKAGSSSEPPPVKGTRDQTVPPGGSYDMTATERKRMPQRGFPQNPRLTDVNAAGTGAQIAVKDVLEMLGIRAEYKAGSWKVSSVTANNVGEKAGVLPGDVVEAMNDQVIREKTQFGRSFQGMSLRVRRNGKPLNLELKP